MAEIIVGVADMKLSNHIDDILVTYALGSCVAVMIYDPVVKVGGLLHFMLPDSSLDSKKAEENPFMFADTGVKRLFLSAYELGASKKRIITKIAGGASILDDSDFFRIGERNVTALRRIFWRNNVIVEAEDTGGSLNRTVRLSIADGKVWVKNLQGYERCL